MPAESPTLGLTHLQLEALLTAARLSADRYDFALVCLLGLLGLRIFESCGTNIADLGEEHGHRVLRVVGKGDKTVLIPLPPAVGRALDRPSATGPPGRSCSTLAVCGWTGTPPPAAYITWRTTPGCGCHGLHPHMLRHTYVTTMLDAGVDLRDVQIAARHADPRTTMRYDRARNHLDRHPNYILAAYMASGT